MNQLVRKLEFQSALRNIYNTPDGKIFFRDFLKHTGVTSPRFTRDPYEMQWNEGRRHLAMSYLSILSQDNAEALIRQIEESKNTDKENE